MALPTAGVTKLLPYLQRMWIPLLNLVGEKNEFRIIITSPDYIEFKVLWGVISYERGEKKEFVVRGTEPYVQSIVSSLSSRGLRVTKVLR